MTINSLLNGLDTGLHSWRRKTTKLPVAYSDFRTYRHRKSYYNLLEYKDR